MLAVGERAVEPSLFASATRCLLSVAVRTVTELPTTCIDAERGSAALQVDWQRGIRL